MIKLFLIGLGNFDVRYFQTRHNLGCLWLDFIVQQKQLTWRNDFLSLQATYQEPGYQLVFIKLKTLMNTSGVTLKQVMKKMQIKPHEVIICVDNIDLPLYKSKLTRHIPDNGHKGLANIRQHLATVHFKTLHLGIGKNKPQTDWVLSAFSVAEKKQLEQYFFPYLMKNLLHTLSQWDGKRDLISDFYQQKNRYNGVVDMVNSNFYQQKTTPKKNLAIIGGQWGDEGKGKLVDYFASSGDYQVGARFSGGNNAGHTVYINNEPYYFSILPVSILQPKMVSVIGSNCLIDLEQLVKEIKNLKKYQPVIKLQISRYCHVVMPYHPVFDKLQEEQVRKKQRIGTTQKGIGPCLQDRVGRFGFQLQDLFSEDNFNEKLNGILPIKYDILTKIYKHKLSPLSSYQQDIKKKCLSWFQEIKSYVNDVFAFCNQEPFPSILFEGAQGTLLDINFGTYPFVTSSHVVSWQIGNTFGQVFKNTSLMGVFKAYSSRVGLGYFPTEINVQSSVAKKFHLSKKNYFPIKVVDQNKIASHLVQIGNEYGVVTNRQRRVGWFDAVLAHYACQVNGFDQLALTLLDVLTGLKEVKICVAHQQGVQIKKQLCNSSDCQKNCQYLTLPGWEEPIGNIKNYVDLPVNAQKYVETIENLLKKPITVLSVGKERNQVILRKTKLM